MLNMKMHQIIWVWSEMQTIKFDYKIYTSRTRKLIIKGDTECIKKRVTLILLPIVFVISWKYKY